MSHLIKEFKSRFKNKNKYLIDYITSAIQGYINDKKYKDVKSLCLFVGYARSGHTLVASLLDAHPNIVISIEWNLLLHLKLGYTKNQLIHSIVKRSEYFSTRLKNTWTGYSYKIRDSWQGRYDSLKIIGDKFGEVNARSINKDPFILDLIEKKTGLQPKIIHVVRNPFDMITTTVIRKFEMERIEKKPGPLDLLPVIYRIFQNADIVMKLKKENNYPIHDVFHNNLITNPDSTLRSILDFLEVPCSKDFLENCSEILFKTSNKSRYQITWPSELISFVENEMKKYPFFKQYHFKE